MCQQLKENDVGKRCRLLGVLTRASLHVVKSLQEGLGFVSIFFPILLAARINFRSFSEFFFWKCLEMVKTASQMPPECLKMPRYTLQ